MIKKILIVFLLLTGAIEPTLNVLAQKKNKPKTSSLSSTSTTSFGNTDGITANQLRDYLTFIASDELEGRNTPSRGLDIASLYIESLLRRWGLKPDGENGTYFQRFPVKTERIVADQSKIELNGQTFTYGEDFLAHIITPLDISNSNVVYVSHGWVFKSKNINPYQGIDIKDKVIVTATNALPKGGTNQDLQGKAGEDWWSPWLYAQENGAKAIITFGVYANWRDWNITRSTQTERGRTTYAQQPTVPEVPLIIANPRLIEALFSNEKSNGSVTYAKAVEGDPIAPFELNPAKKVSILISVNTENVFSKNVIGVLEGSDPVLKNEFVGIGAHYDHLGMNLNVPGTDKIWNGADDDGSGTVAVMAIAEAAATGRFRPKRSLVFIWHGGEEKGLWGSRHFTEYPTIALDSITAYLNIDMIGRYQNPEDEIHSVNKQLPKPGEIFVTGSKLMSSELGEISEATNKAFLNLSFNYKYDDPKDPQQFFPRSDHYNYARKGIPIIFYMDGVHADYHRPSDSVEKINFDQMEKVTKTIFATAWTLANTANRPKVDKPLTSK